jgi:hypothetical protein
MFSSLQHLAKLGRSIPSASLGTGLRPYKRNFLSLALLVFRVDANHPHHTAPMDHLAFVTNLSYGCSNFH